MSLKGHKFTHADLPRATQERIKNKQVGPEEQKRLDDHLARQTERYRIVAMNDGVPIIAEELDERLMRRAAETPQGIDADVLRNMRNLMLLTQDQRAQIMNAIDMDGVLLNDFEDPPPPEEDKPAKKLKK